MNLNKKKLMESPNFSTIKQFEKTSYNKNSLSPNRLLFNVSSNSNSKTQNMYSNFKFFTTTSQKINSFFLSNKKNRDSSVKEASSSKSKQPFQITLCNQEQYYSTSNSKQTTTKNTSTFNYNNNKYSTASFNRQRKVCIGSVKKNLLTTLQEPSVDPVKETTNESFVNEEEDLEKMVDYIISSTKTYRRECNWSIENKENVNSENVLNERYNSCKCKKIGCSKYSCNCLKKGTKCGKFCLCCNCQNK